MQDQNTNSTNNENQLFEAEAAAKQTADAVVNRAAHADYVTRIVEKLKTSENILVALSKNPSVDEICAAIGLTLFLDGMQRHVTAIYSGKTPNALEFLQPEATFETNTDSLQDFIIALSKEKADHLRYKLEGDFVKVYITPYRTNITEEDLSFSRGDFNVDFVVAINVPSAGDLDEALSEHGQLMHDASIVDITRSDSGHFGEIEWSNPAASSVSEMVTQLIFAMQGDDKTLDQDVATALLTGIVAATERFSNNRTNPDTLGLASKLMAMGADQQLISANVLGNNADETKEPEPEPEGSILPNPTTVPDPVMYGGTVVLPDVNSMNQATQPENPAAQMAPDTPEVVGPEPANVEIGAPLTSDTLTLPVMPQGDSATQKDYAGMIQQELGTSTPAPTEPVDNTTMALPGEPVAKPETAILPPPPAPPAMTNADGVPTLPPVQVPPKP